MSVNDTNSVTTTPTSDSILGTQNSNTGSVKLQEFSIYEGIVDDVDYLTRRLTVYINNRPVHNCVYAAGAIAPLLGFSSTQLPAIGTQVLCLYSTQTTWVIGAQPSFYRNIKQYAGDIGGVNKYSQIGDKDIGHKYDNFDDVQIFEGYPTSRDLLPGEEEISNNVGVALRLLTNLAQLDSGGLAKIECHLMNDMVRIVDGYYAHHNCGGDTLIWNNGRNNYEDHFTQYPHEAAGKLTENEPYAEPFDNFKKQDVYQSIGSDISGTGRWRKSTYIGFLGDMMHYWITHPTEVISNYAQQAARASRFKTWVGADGTLLVQAAGDIVLQVTQYMSIPQIHYKWDDPEYNVEEVMSNLDSEYLKIWGSGEKHWEDLTVACWQMRNYLKYLTVWHSLQRFRQVSEASGKKYCTIPCENDTSLVGNTDCGEQDKKEAGANTPSTGGSGSALLCMGADGSISLIQGNSCSCIFNQGNLQLVAPYNIEIKAGNMLSVTAKDISIKAARNVEVASLFGAVYTKAKSALKMLCERGRVWIKGDAPNFENISDFEEMPVEFNKYSVVIDSAQGETLVHGNKGVTVGTDDEAGKVTIQATGVSGSVDIYAKKLINILSRGEILINTMQMGISSLVTKVKGNVFKIFDKLKISPGVLDLAGLLRSTHIRTPSMMYAHNGYQTAYNSRIATTKEEYIPENLVNSTPVPEDKSADAIGDRAKDLNVEDVKIDYQKDEFRNGKEQWELYNWFTPYDSVSNPNSLKADPWLDTFINCEDNLDKEWFNKYVKMEWSSKNVQLCPATRTATKNVPWPGVAAQIFVFDKDTIKNPINTPLDRDFNVDDIATIHDMDNKDLVYYFYKE